MKGFIEVTINNELHLINVSHIIMVSKHMIGKNEITKVALAMFGKTFVKDVPNDTPPSKLIDSEIYTVHIVEPYQDVVNKIKDALM